ncbi:aminotransferase class III-fold pyridoxal phosphate-dependent enzyme [Streptomyces sp. NPDC088387]|uniref:aminotransferase class III-fold pyridoxal phosphate-dependent enzyme n=1 Tax=Streptomyces sp. NPDC088387 TaxID=3365859 RepID=UPI0038128152
MTEGTLHWQPAREGAARTYARALPIVPVRARGLTIEGADGRRYLDCLSGAGALALGHNHPVVLEAIRKVLDSGAPLHTADLTTPVEDAFVTELIRTVPHRLADQARVRLSGPTARIAVYTAVQLARAATGRTEILDFTGTTTDTGFYGVTVSGAGAGTGMGAGAGAGAGSGTGSGIGVGTGARARPASGWAQPGGVFLSPVHGDGEVGPAPDAWLRHIRQLSTARSIPLIVDESETGVGRTGTFWGVEHSGVTPDVMVLSRAIGGSLPLAVVVHRDDLPSEGPGIPSDTFRGNQLAMAAGTATLAHARENRLADRAATLGDRILRQLRELAKGFTWIENARGRGLLAGFDCVRRSQPESPKQNPIPHPAPQRDTECADPVGDISHAAPDLAAAVQRECLRRGLIVGVGGRQLNVVRLLPPLTISDEQTAAVLDRLSDAIAAIDRGPAAHG